MPLQHRINCPKKKKKTESKHESTVSISVGTKAQHRCEINIISDLYQFSIVKTPLFKKQIFQSIAIDFLASR